MRFEGEGKLLRIFIGESDHTHGKPLYQAIVEKAREEGLAGATVLRGIEGFGARSHHHTARILRLSDDLPIIIEIVDTEESIERVLPMFDALIGDGLVTVERVQVMLYRAGERQQRPIIEDRLRMLAAEVGSSGYVTPEIEASIRAAHEYGATERQIAEASHLPESEVRLIIERS
jgi:uncharacterized protein